MPTQIGRSDLSDVKDDNEAPQQRSHSKMPMAVWDSGDVTQAILLVGGQGTRLRPLTISTPKPMLPVAGHSCTEHQIALAQKAGVTRIVLGTSYRAEVFEQHFAQHDLGIDIAYAVENEPLGTGGAIRNAASQLTCGPDDPVVVFNGDVITGLDVATLVQKWREAEADVALYLTRVSDPRAYGLVPTDSHGKVLAFTEKPQTDAEIVTDQINAGCYVFRRSVIDEIPQGRPVSVERETFPALLARNATVIGVVDDSYWLDLGTPLSFAQGSADLVRGIAPSPLLAGKTGDALIDATAHVEPDAVVTGGSYVAAGARIEAGSLVDGSIIYPGATIGRQSRVINSIVGARSAIGNGAVLRDAVVAQDCAIGDSNELIGGARVFPGTHLGPTSVRFSSDQ